MTRELHTTPWYCSTGRSRRVYMALTSGKVGHVYNEFGVAGGRIGVGVVQTAVGDGRRRRRRFLSDDHPVTVVYRSYWAVLHVRYVVAATGRRHVHTVLVSTQVYADAITISQLRKKNRDRRLVSLSILFWPYQNDVGCLIDGYVSTTRQSIKLAPTRRKGTTDTHTANEPWEQSVQHNSICDCRAQKTTLWKYPVDSNSSPGQTAASGQSVHDFAYEKAYFESDFIVESRRIVTSNTKTTIIRTVQNSERNLMFLSLFFEVVSVDG